MSAKYCPSCTKETTSDALVCEHCRTRLDPVISSRNTIRDNSNMNKPILPNSSPLGKFGLMFAVFILISSILGFFVYKSMIGAQPSIPPNGMPKPSQPDPKVEIKEDKIEGVSDKTKAEIIQNDPTTVMRKKVAQLLVGRKSFGVQFIYDGYGKAQIEELGQVMSLKGSQYSKNKEEYTRIEGTLVPMSETEMIFNGIIEIYTDNCCDTVKKSGIYTFRKTGTRKYWRLKELNSLCNEFTCAYYLDIFE